MPLAGGIAASAREEILVDRIALAIDARLLVHVGLEAAALLGRVGQFAEGVGEFDAAGIELEAFRDARIAGFGPRQRRLRDRIFAQDRGAAAGRDAARCARQDAAEDVRPGVVGGDADAGLDGVGGEPVAIDIVIGRHGAQQVDAGMAAGRPPAASAARARRRDRPRGRASAGVVVAGRLGRQRPAAPRNRCISAS